MAQAIGIRAEIVVPDLLRKGNAGTLHSPRTPRHGLQIECRTGWVSLFGRPGVQLRLKGFLSTPMAAPKFPTRKISETLLDFAQPFVAQVDSKMPQETIRQGFNIAVTIWNAFVMDRVNGNSDYQAMMQEQLGAQWEQNPLIRALVDRRKKLFADDMRFIAEHRVSFDPGGYKVSAAAIDPYASSKA